MSSLRQGFFDGRMLLSQVMSRQAQKATAVEARVAQALAVESRG